MKHKITAKLLSALLVGLLLTAASASAQTAVYRQRNLASDVSAPGFANHITPSLRNPWGIAFLPELPFIAANSGNGLVIAQDAIGSPAAPVGFGVPDIAGTSSGAPTGIVADPDSFFGGGNFVQPFLLVSKDGGIYIWGPDEKGDIPTAATLVVDRSQSGAVYTALAILKPDCCAPSLAVANFHSGQVETYDTNFAPLKPFTDPNLPAGFAPFGMQVVGTQLFRRRLLSGTPSDETRTSPSRRHVMVEIFFQHWSE